MTAKNQRRPATGGAWLLLIAVAAGAAGVAIGKYGNGTDSGGAEQEIGSWRERAIAAERSLDRHRSEAKRDASASAAKIAEFGEQAAQLRTALSNLQQDRRIANQRHRCISQETARNTAAALGAFRSQLDPKTPKAIIKRYFKNFTGFIPGFGDLATIGASYYDQQQIVQQLNQAQSRVSQAATTAVRKCHKRV